MGARRNGEVAPQQLLSSLPGSCFLAEYVFKDRASQRTGEVERPPCYLAISKRSSTLHERPLAALFMIARSCRLRDQQFLARRMVYEVTAGPILYLISRAPNRGKRTFLFHASDPPASRHTHSYIFTRLCRLFCSATLPTNQKSGSVARLPPAFFRFPICFVGVDFVHVLHGGAVFCCCRWRSCCCDY